MTAKIYTLEELRELTLDHIEEHFTEDEYHKNITYILLLKNEEEMKLEAGLPKEDQEVNQKQKTVKELVDVYEPERVRAEASTSERSERNQKPSLLEDVDDNEEYEEIVIEEEAPSKITKKSKKGDIIEDIKRIWKVRGIEPDVYVGMDMTKKELLEYLGNLLNKGVDEFQNNPTIPLEGVETTQHQLPCNVDMGARGLFQFNSLLCTFVEQLSESKINKTQYRVKGYADSLREHEDQMMEMYAEIYRRHWKSLAPYLGTGQMILLMNMQIMSKCIVKN